MKKLLMLLTIAGSVQFVQAQDLKKVNTWLLLNKTEEAKTEIDKAIADPKFANKPETWFLKYRVYASIAADSKLADKFTKAYLEADDALAKYEKLEPSEKTLLDKNNNGQTGAFDLYKVFNKNGVLAYNAKNYDSAGFYFSKSVSYLDIIVKNKWTTDKLTMDTIGVLYAGAAYESAKKKDEAVKYFGRLADAKVVGSDYHGIYRFLLLYYIDNKNADKFQKYLALAKELYPNDKWTPFELEFFSKGYSLKEKADLFDKEDITTVTSDKWMYYGDAFANINKEDRAALDSTQQIYYQKKAIEAFRRAADKNPTDGLAAFNVGVLNYNEFTIYDEQYHDNIKKLQQINANRIVEKDPKKKAASDAAYKESVAAVKKANSELEQPLIETIDIAIKYLENAFNILSQKAKKSGQEKSCLTKSVDYLANLFAYKRDKARGKDVKAYDIYDAKYKTYDDFHGKL